MSACGVLPLGDVRAPFRVRPPVAWRLGDRQVGHVIVWGRTVPVPYVGGCDDNVAGPDLFDIAAPRLVQA